MRAESQITMHFSKLITRLPSIAQNCIHDIAEDPWIEEAAPHHSAQKGQISFYESVDQVKIFEHTSPSALILPLNTKLQAHASQAGIAWVESANPKLTFAECLNILHPEEPITPGIDASAHVDPSASIAEDVYIGPLAAIGADCKIGPGCIIHSCAVLHRHVTIGNSCEIHSGAVIFRQTNIGNNCVIHANAVIGSEGFGFVRTSQGLKKVPQTGRVVLEDYVEIGCNSCVDRPAMGETRIGRGTKIDNLVQVGHGVQIGPDCALAAQVGIAGAARLGRGVVLGGQVGVADKIDLGDGVIAYAKTAIPGNVTAGNVVCGIPAMPAKLFGRSAAVFKALPEMARKLRRLQNELEKLKQKTDAS